MVEGQFKQIIAYSLDSLWYKSNGSILAISRQAIFVWMKILFSWKIEGTLNFKK